jgi:hypothetical protein
MLPTFFNLWSQPGQKLLDSSLPSGRRLAHVMPGSGLGQSSSLRLATQTKGLNQFIRLRDYVSGVIDKR